MPTVQNHLEKAGSYIQTAADSVGAVIATGAITLPWWRGNLHDVSTVASDLAPIIGVLWLVIQSIHRVSHWNKGDESIDED